MTSCIVMTCRKPGRGKEGPSNRKRRRNKAEDRGANDHGDFLGLGPFLSSLLGGLRCDTKSTQHDGGVTSPITTTAVDASGADSSSLPSPELVRRTPLPTKTQIPEQALLSRVDVEIESTTEQDVKFVGIFFRLVCGIHS